MSPTIRIDDEVWAWLKGLAQPFEDTPNTVLRRVAGLDGEPPESLELRRGASPRSTIPLEEERMKTAVRAAASLGRRITGDVLNHRFGLGARHALYHKDGTFYERLSEFPGVLCDPSGYVRYENEHQFASDPRLSIGVKVNVHGGLNTHPRYDRFAAR